LFFGTQVDGHSASTIFLDIFSGCPTLQQKIDTTSIQGCPVRELRLVPIPYLGLG